MGHRETGTPISAESAAVSFRGAPHLGMNLRCGVFLEKINKIKPEPDFMVLIDRKSYTGRETVLYAGSIVIKLRKEIKNGRENRIL